MDIKKQKEIAALQSRYDRLKMNGRNLEGKGVLRKIKRKINKLKMEDK